MTSAGQPYSAITNPTPAHKLVITKKKKFGLFRSNDGNQDLSEPPEEYDKRTRLRETMRKPIADGATKKRTGMFPNLNDAFSQPKPPGSDRNPDLSPSMEVFNNTSEPFAATQNNCLDGDILGRSLSHPTGGERPAGNGTPDVQTLVMMIQKLKQDMQTMSKDHVNMTQQLSTTKQDLDEERRKKGSQEDLRQHVGRLQVDLQSCREEQGNTELRLKFKEEEARTLCAKNQSLQEKTNKLEDDLLLVRNDFHSSQETVKGLINEVTEWKESYDGIQEQFQNASDELNHIKSDLRTVRDDEFFRLRFVKLQADIEQWAEDHFGGKLQSPSFFDQPAKEPRLPTELATVCRDCRDMLREDSTRHWIVESYLWRFLEDTIFDSRPESHLKGIVWAQRVRTEFCILEEFLRPGISFSSFLEHTCRSSFRTDPNVSDEERRKFLKWKANTAKMIISRNQRDYQNREEATNQSMLTVTSRYHVYGDQMRIHFRRDNLQCYIDAVLQVTRPWLTSNDERKCREDLFFILRWAIEFDAYMHEQWAHFFTATKPTHEATKKRYEFPFDGNFMACASRDYQMQRYDMISLVVSPALIRSGTSNGDDYGLEEVVLSKSRVLPQGFNPKDLQKKPPPRQWISKSKDGSQPRNFLGF